VEYKLFAVRVFVSDWDRAIRFYSETLGMTFVYQSDEMGWAQMAPGAGQLALERVDPSDEEGRFTSWTLCRRVPFRFLISWLPTKRSPSAACNLLGRRRKSRGVASLRICASPTGMF
jgi:catechol 2,3-dioxygenase-like lactoylglutathione lyase family enzyme